MKAKEQLESRTKFDRFSELYKEVRCNFKDPEYIARRKRKLFFFMPLYLMKVSAYSSWAKIVS